MWSRRYFSVVNFTFFLISTIFLRQVVSSLNCTAEYNSFGNTSPPSDIHLEVGSDLEINCTLNSNNEYNASSLYWNFNNTHDILQEEFPVFPNGNKTATLLIRSTTKEDSGVYTCMVRTDSGPMTVCNNAVIVGTPPTGNVSISCINWNWESINCTWSLPLNLEPTTWELNYTRFKTSDHTCEQSPSSTKQEYRCVIHYPPVGTQTIKMRLRGNNTYGNSLTKFAFNQTDFALLKPVRELKMSSDSTTLKWKSPLTAQTTLRPIIYRLQYSNSFTDIMEYNTTNQEITLNDLIPNLVYTFNVSCQLDGTKLSQPWSDVSGIKVRIPAAVPDKQVEIATGSFMQEIIGNSSRSVTVYWKAIPSLNFNGDGFVYVVSYGNQHSPTTVDNTQYSFTNLSMFQSYNFSIKTENQVGKSEKSSTLHVPSSMPGAAQPPIVYDVIQYENLTYEISWSPTDSTDGKNISSTVFWCKSKIPAKTVVECEYPGISGVTVENNTTLTTQLPDGDHLYKFAVSLNEGFESSGLVWAECVIPLTKDQHNIRTLTVERVGTTWAFVKWEVVCEERSKAIGGYILEYKKDESGSVTTEINGADNYSYNLTGLSPNTEYSIQIAVKKLQSYKKEKSTRALFYTISDSTDPIIVIVIVLSVVLGFMCVCVLAWYLIRRYLKILGELKNIPLPKGLLDRAEMSSSPCPSPTYIPTDKLEKNFHWPLILPASPTSPNVYSYEPTSPAFLNLNTSRSSIFSTDSSGIPPSPKLENGNRPSTDSGVVADMQDDVFEPSEPIQSGYSRIGPYSQLVLDVNGLHTDLPISPSYSKLAIMAKTPNDTGKVENHYVTMPVLNIVNMKSLQKKENGKTSESNMILGIESTNPPTAPTQENLRGGNNGYIRYPFI